MKSVKAAASLFLLSSIPAIAADLPSIKSAPVIAPTPMWSGFYAGLNAGGTWANNNTAKIQEYGTYYNPVLTASPTYQALTSFGSSIGVPTNSSGGFIGGGQLGFNQQFMNSFVAGGEVDIQGVVETNPNSASTAQSFIVTYASATRPGRILSAAVDNAYSTSKSLSYLGTARGRLGYLVTPSLLVYGTAGLAYGGVNLSTNIWQRTESGIYDYEFEPGSKSSSQTKIGWTAGGGVEWMFLNNWSAKVEYLYYDLGTASMYSGAHTNVWEGSFVFPGISAGQISTMYGFNSSSRFNGNIVRAGVNYHFNFASAPVVAKF
jgi:outer membrane immunogenic protein